MRSVFAASTCLTVLALSVLPVRAAEGVDIAEPMAVTLSVQPSGPQAVVAAQTTQTLQAVAAMRDRLSDLVPFVPRTDAISLRAADYAAQWQSVIEGYAEDQMQLVDTMITGLNLQTQQHIEAFLSAEPMTPPESLFDGTNFDFTTDFSNPPIINAGFFGS